MNSSTDFEQTTRDIVPLGTSSISAVSKKNVVQKLKVPKPAWVDDDDEKLQVDITKVPRLRKLRESENENVIKGEKYAKRLRTQFQKLNQPMSWAKLPHQKQTIADPDSDSDAIDNLSIFQSSAPLTNTKKLRLPIDKLNITRVKDANATSISKSVVNSIEFHPNGQLLLTAGLDKTLRLFQIDGSRNNKIQAVSFKNFRIHQASFTSDGTSILLTGTKPNFFTYDLLSDTITRIPGIKGRPEHSWRKFAISPHNDCHAFVGLNGYAVLIDRRSNQSIGTVRHSNQIVDLKFSKNENQLSTFGTQGRMLIWDIRTRRCELAWQDSSVVHATSMSMTLDGQYYATGSDSGVVNLFSMASVKENSIPSPIHSFMNLKTRIDKLCFSHDNQILVASSRSAEDSLRVFHLASGRCFSNWPRQIDRLSCVQSIALSPDSAYLSVGNDKGKALLYRMNDYVS